MCHPPETMVNYFAELQFMTESLGNGTLPSAFLFINDMSRPQRGLY